jgi:hypothetical protein
VPQNCLQRYSGSLHPCKHSGIPKENEDVPEEGEQEEIFGCCPIA